MKRDVVEKVKFWQERHKQAGLFLTYWFVNNMDFYDVRDYAYVKAWQEEQAYAYRQIQRHRGF